MVAHVAAHAPEEACGLVGGAGGRATQVARFLVEHETIAGARVKATAFSDTRPLREGDSPEALASNRRVDIVVESNEEDQVRALLPGLAEAAETS